MTDVAPAPLFSDDYWRDPFAALGELRERGPVHEVDLPEGGRTWLVTRYADARSVMADPRFVKDFRNTLPEDQRASIPGIPSPGGEMMLLNDPPVHTRLRKLVVKAFTVRRVAALRPRIEEMAASLLTGLPGDTPVDLVEAYAVPLPTAVICELLGVPVDDQDAFGAWSRTLIDDSGEAATQQANASLAAYLAELVERKRAERDGDYERVAKLRYVEIPALEKELEAADATSAAPVMLKEEVGPDGRSTIHPEALEEWRAWLAAHHGRGRGTWVVSWKQATGRPAIGYEELVCEALAWGWIDSTAGTHCACVAPSCSTA